MSSAREILRLAGPALPVLAAEPLYLLVDTAVVGVLPLIWASLAFGGGLAGIWSGLAAFMLVRLVAVLLRVRGDRWFTRGFDRFVVFAGDGEVREAPEPTWE